MSHPLIIKYSVYSLALCPKLSIIIFLTAEFSVVNFLIISVTSECLLSKSTATYLLVVTSRQVAEDFEKEHFNVVRDKRVSSKMKTPLTRCL